MGQVSYLLKMTHSKCGHGVGVLSIYFSWHIAYGTTGQVCCLLKFWRLKILRSALILHKIKKREFHFSIWLKKFTVFIAHFSKNDISALVYYLVTVNIYVNVSKPVQILKHLTIFLNLIWQCIWYKIWLIIWDRSVGSQKYWFSNRNNTFLVFPIVFPTIQLLYLGKYLPNFNGVSCKI